MKQGVIDILGDPAGQPGGDCRQTVALLLHMDQVSPRKYRTACGYPRRVSLISLADAAQLFTAGKPEPGCLLIQKRTRACGTGRVGNVLVVTALPVKKDQAEGFSTDGDDGPRHGDEVFDSGNKGYLLVDLDPGPEKLSPFLRNDPENARRWSGQSVEHDLECRRDSAPMETVIPVGKLPGGVEQDQGDGDRADINTCYVSHAHAPYGPFTCEHPVFRVSKRSKETITRCV